jgi:hypothetical protein
VHSVHGVRPYTYIRAPINQAKYMAPLNSKNPPAAVVSGDPRPRLRPDARRSDIAPPFLNYLPAPAC